MNCLETVHDDLVALDDLHRHQKVPHVGTVVPLHLQHVAVHLVVHHGAVAVQLLLQVLRDLLQVEVVVEAGDGEDTLSSVTLLDADVHLVPGPAGRRLLVLERV